MFTTFRTGKGVDTLLEVQHSRRRPASINGPHHDACVECRQKKYRCSGERTGCDRCCSQGKTCTYVGNRYTRKGPGRARASISSARGSFAPDDTGLRQAPIPSSPSASLLVGSKDSAVDMTELPDCASNESDPTSSDQGWRCAEHDDWSHELSVDHDFFMDPPSFFNHVLSDQDMHLFSPAQPSLTGPITADSPKGDLSDGESSTSTTTTTSPPRSLNATATRQHATADHKCSHECAATALQHLEVALSGPQHRAAPGEIIRFLGHCSRCMQSLTVLSKCTTCIRSSPFILLLAITAEKWVDALAEVMELLVDRNIDTSNSQLLQGYGVETPDEFVHIFSPVLLPLLPALKSIVAQLKVRSASEKVLGQIGRKLEELEFQVRYKL